MAMARNVLASVRACRRDRLLLEDSPSVVAVDSAFA